jgi:hypothetical protein
VEHCLNKAPVEKEVEICGLLGYYTASCGNYLPTFRDNVTVPSSRVKFSWFNVFRMSGRDEKYPPHRGVLTLISGFRRDVDEICGRLGYCTASCGNYLPTLPRLFGGLSLRRAGLNPRSFHVRSVVKKWHWDRFLSEYLCFPLCISHHQWSSLIFSCMVL